MALKINITHADIDNKKSFLFFNNLFSDEYVSNQLKNILLVPCASFEAKIYPPEKFAQIANKINANFIIIWGSPSEKLIAEKIKELSPNVQITRKLSFNKLKALISKVDLVIGADTGPTHMAWALNKASITLFGPTPGYRNTYVTKINKFIESKSHVNPHKINKDDLSIKDIDIQQVYEMAKNLLK